MYGNTGCGVFDGGINTKLERFLAKNQLQSNSVNNLLICTKFETPQPLTIFSLPTTFQEN